MRSNAAKEWSGTFKELEAKRQKLKRFRTSQTQVGKTSFRRVNVTFALERHRGPIYTDWMKHRVDSSQGKEIYSHRMSVVEPVFGNIGTNKRLNRFSLRAQGYEYLNTDIAGLKPIKGNQSENWKWPGELAG